MNTRHSRVIHHEPRRAGILGKVTHLQPVERFEWDHAVDMAELGMGRDPDRYAEEMRAFLEGADDEPWFLMLNAHDPHRPFHGAEDVGRFFSDQQQEGILPPAASSPPVRRNPFPVISPTFPRCGASTPSTSARPGAATTSSPPPYGVLEDTGTSEDTVVVFLSDNGMAFPFSKANCYLQSTRTPLIVRWPGSVAPGTRVESAFVSMLDLFATFCDITGATATPNDGSSLVPLLTGTTEQHRDHVVTVFHETAAKKRYEMRCVQDGTHGYIWNGWADGETEYRAENMIGLTWNAMVEAAQQDSALAERVSFYQSRQAEELYDLAADPDALHDLSGDPSVRLALAGMREALRAWMVETADPQLAAFDASLRD